MKLTNDGELICHCGRVMQFCPDCYTEYCEDPKHGRCRCERKKDGQEALWGLLGEPVLWYNEG